MVISVLPSCAVHGGVAQLRKSGNTTETHFWRLQLRVCGLYRDHRFVAAGSRRKGPRGVKHRAFCGVLSNLHSSICCPWRRRPQGQFLVLGGLQCVVFGFRVCVAICCRAFIIPPSAVLLLAAARFDRSVAEPIDQISAITGTMSTGSFADEAAMQAAAHDRGN